MKKISKRKLFCLVVVVLVFFSLPIFFLLFAITAAIGITPEDVYFNNTNQPDTFFNTQIDWSDANVDIPEGKFPWPVNSRRITSPYGWRKHPIFKDKRFHNGLDIGEGKGKPIYAVHDGEVIYASYKGDYGMLVIIDHSSYGYPDITTFYAHLSPNGVIKKGKKVKKGTIIGNIGMTGRTTGPHLHFEIRIKGKSINPVLMLN